MFSKSWFSAINSKYIGRGFSLLEAAGMGRTEGRALLANEWSVLVEQQKTEDCRFETEVVTFSWSQ